MKPYKTSQKEKKFEDNDLSGMVFEGKYCVRVATSNDMLHLKPTSWSYLGNGYRQKDKIKAKPDKTEHEMESMEKSKVNQSQPKVNSVKVKDGAELRFSKYETAKELWEAILKTFGGNEATNKTKKNQLKLQYGNFKAEGSETLEQTFNRLQAIMSHLEFMDFEIEQDDLNQKFLTNTSSRKGEVHTASVPTVSIQVSTPSTDVAAASLSHDTICSIMSKPMIKFVKEADCPRVIKINNTENARKSTVKYAEMYRNISKVKNQPRVPRVSTVTEKIPTVDSKFSTTKSTLTADLGDKGKVVKASARWIRRPKQNTYEQGPNCNGVSVTFKKYQYTGTQGRLKSVMAWVPKENC
nr:hypothetical protein [Tanacetum cinerariifolium]GEX97513.1 hypothetical protein [Tanacetum cinerariifolium]